MSGMATRSQLVRAHLAMLFASTAFSGLNVLVAKVLRRSADGQVDPLVFGLYRDCIALPLLVAMCLLSGHASDRAPISRRDALLGVLCGLVGIFGLQLCYLYGLQLTSPDNVAVWVCVSPAMTGFLAVLTGLESPSARRFVGVALGCGAIVVMSYDSFGGAGGSLAGQLALLANCVFSAVYVLAQKPLFRAGHSPLLVTSASYAVGAAAVAVAAALRFAGRPDDAVWTISPPATGVLVYASVVCSALAYAFMSWANQHLDATIVASYAVVQPSATALLSWLFLGEVPTWQLGVACVLTAASLVILSGAGRWQSSRRNGAAGEVEGGGGDDACPVNGSPLLSRDERGEACI